MRDAPRLFAELPSFLRSGSPRSHSCVQAHVGRTACSISAASTLLGVMAQREKEGAATTARACRLFNLCAGAPTRRHNASRHYVFINNTVVVTIARRRRRGRTGGGPARISSNGMASSFTSPLPCLKTLSVIPALAACNCKAPGPPARRGGRMAARAMSASRHTRGTSRVPALRRKDQEALHPVPDHDLSAANLHDDPRPRHRKHCGLCIFSSGLEALADHGAPPFARAAQPRRHILLIALSASCARASLGADAAARNCTSE